MTGILSQLQVSTDNLRGICSYVKSDFVFARNWHKRIFYLNLVDGREIRLNVGLKPDHKLALEFESLIQELSDDLNIKYVSN